MPNDVDVRGMTDGDLVENLNDHVVMAAGVGVVDACCDELESRLSALHSEVERLKAELAKQPWKWEEVAVMRELCLQAQLKAEAERLLKADEILHSDYAVQVQSYNDALDAYRAIKGEK